MWRELEEELAGRADPVGAGNEPPGMSEISPFIADKEQVNGPFSRQANLSQRLKRLIPFYFCRDMPEEEADIYEEALDMILHKVARVMAGNPQEVDHWQDIAGYATLVVEYLEREQ